MDRTILDLVVGILDGKMTTTVNGKGTPTTITIAGLYPKGIDFDGSHKQRLKSQLLSRGERLCENGVSLDSIETELREITAESVRWRLEECDDRLVAAGSSSVRGVSNKPRGPWTASGE